MKISEDNLTPKEKEIYKHFKDRYLSEEYHPLILYSVQQLLPVEVRYRYDDNDNLLLNKEDLGKAFSVNNGSGYQEYRASIKELVDNLADYMALVTYILRSIGISESDSRLSIYKQQKDWYNDYI